MTAFAITACGGSDAPEPPEPPEGAVEQPRPKEPITTKVDELDAAIAQESCERYVPLVHSFSRENLASGTPPTKSECRVFESGVLQDLQGTRSVDSEEFGTGAIIEGPAGAGETSTRTTAWVVDRDGEYRIADAFDGPPQIGSEAPSEDAGQAAETFVDAVIEADCEKLGSVLNPTGRLSRGAAGVEECERIFDGQVFAPAVRATPATQPVELGTTANLAFYGVPTEDAYFTLLLSDAGEPSGAMTVRDALPSTPVSLPEARRSPDSNEDE